MDQELGAGRHGILVGYDGSSGAKAAVLWAADEAARRGDQLTVMHSVNLTGVVPTVSGLSTALGEVDDGVLAAAANEGAELAVQRNPSLRVRSVGMLDGAAHSLVRASERTGLIVIGSHGSGGVSDALGSTALSVSTHAKCPVIVVRPAGDSVVRPGPDSPIVVGLDGSLPSADALDLAASWAADVGSELRLVSSWDVSSQLDWVGKYLGRSVDHVETREAVQREAEGTVAAARDRVLARYPDLTVTTSAVEGAAVQVLAQQSRHAGMVAVGSRGRGGFTALLLGSVSRGLVQRAHCPVFVVKHRKGFDPDDAPSSTAP